ncbi:FG-GAP repeat domain-containing protein [Streptomyces sp. NPDC056503]|uniref:FG-GAP repeat domain-containing protein n=1 Tax=Streptomyces sp. NPDC056503 TaxID=3345842 RepID=UPI003691B971
MQHRTAGTTRLATAITAVLAVTAIGAGTLSTAPAAFAAPPAAVSAAEADSLPAFPTGASVTATGPGGFLTYDSYPSDPSRELLWTPYDGGAPTALPRPEGGAWAASGGDVVALGDAGFTSEFRKLTLRNMAEPAAPGVELDLGAIGGNYVAVLGPKSVLAQITDADGTAELHVVTKDGTGTTTRAVPGLPADATDFFTSAPVRDGIAFVAYETGPAGARKGGRAVIDLGRNKVLETYDSTESGYGFSHLLFSATHVAWLDWRSGTGMFITSVDRTTRAVKETVLGSREDSWHTELVGDWLVYGAPESPVSAVSLTDGTKHTVADSATGSASAADGSMVLTGARGQDGDGLFRIAAPAGGGAPTVTKVADMVLPQPLTIDRADIPARVNLDRTGGEVRLGWTLSRADAYMFVTFTHVATGKEYQQYVHSPAGDENFSVTWDGHFGDVDAPNGAYTVLAEAESLDGVGGRVRRSGQMTLTRDPNPHDYTNNGSTDVLARDAAGVLWRDDLRDRPVTGQVTTAQRTKVGAGWNTYRQIEAVGSIAGAAHGDLVALDGAGTLWHYLGKGDGTFTARAKVGGGWQIYNKITGGSDLDADGRADLLATDAAGTLWFYKGTGSVTKPFATRVKVGGGWQVYNQITAVGNIAGTAAGDLVARDTAGVLWLYQGNGRGGFGGRVQVGGGWGAFSHLVGAGDVDSDGRPDLVAHGKGGTYVYKSTGSSTRPFTRVNTNLYAGEGTTFTSVS